MVWRRPRWSARLQPEPVTDLLTEAHAVGVVGRGALSSPLRRMLAGEPDDAVIAAMAKVLPAPIDHFLVQADLTVIVPGPLERALAEQLAAVATVESAGAAMVYRITGGSVRRALDTGKTAGDLHALFTKHSKTPVPQSLTYMIDDVARRHGQLRVGIASSFVRCEDGALLAQAVAAPATESVELRLLATTVAVSHSPIADVLAALRAAGFAPAAEDSTGAIVDLRSRGSRVPVPGRRRGYRHNLAPTDQTLGAIVAVLRKVAAMVQAGSSIDELALTDAAASELGRFLVTRETKDLGAFKTPHLRNVALTAPYMHDGSEPTLASVIELYDRGGNANPYLDGGMRPLALTDQEKADLVALMETFTSSDLARFDDLVKQASQ
jgi:hypothetical protein